MNDKKIRVWDKYYKTFGYIDKGKGSEENNKTFTLSDAFSDPYITFKAYRRFWNIIFWLQHINCILKKKDDYIITEFTGLKDCYRNEVYEGDIVLINNKEYVVKYYPSWGSFVFEYIKYNEHDIISGKKIQQSKFIVIGNVFENSDYVENSEFNETYLE